MPPFLLINIHIMLIKEIILKKSTKDTELLSTCSTPSDLIKSKLHSYVDKLVGQSDKKIRSDLLIAIHDGIDELNNITKQESMRESINKVPLLDSDFDRIKKLLSEPIPAILAPIYLNNIIEDDELSDNIDIIAEASPERDIRKLISEWIVRNMPDQLYRFTGAVDSDKRGEYSPISGK